MGSSGVENGNGAGPQHPGDGSAPPAYAADNAELTPEALAELTSAFSSLHLPSSPADLSPDSCLAHLKLLYAFQNLKDDVGYTDGLWQIFDSRAELDTFDYGKDISTKESGPQERVIRNLARLREKRWALYVARAVDRYDAWWDTLPKDPLTEADMESHDQSKYSGFIKEGHSFPFDSSMLPPLDVLLVWHSHMLNPRAYLEDCLRHGLKGLWHMGLPWNLVNGAIDAEFNYKATEECQNSWKERTWREWDNVNDPPKKSLKCPVCSKKCQIPWTTCGLPEDYKYLPPKLDGDGFGDGSLRVECSGCGALINRRLLEVARFVKDTHGLLVQERPMPGTILSLQTGLPEKTPEDREGQSFPRTFPNRLLKKHLRSRILELMSRNSYMQPSMEDVRKSIEDTVKPWNYKVLQEIDGARGWKSGYKLSTTARTHLRKMMSRYWDNIYPFALDLTGAVHRQGIFTEKMYKVRDNVPYTHLSRLFCTRSIGSIVQQLVRRCLASY